MDLNKNRALDRAGSSNRACYQFRAAGQAQETRQNNDESKKKHWARGVFEFFGLKALCEPGVWTSPSAFVGTKSLEKMIQQIAKENQVYIEAAALASFTVTYSPSQPLNASIILAGQLSAAYINEDQFIYSEYVPNRDW